MTTEAHTSMATANTTSSLRAPHQGGILEGANPSVYDSKNPIIIFIIQAAIIIIFCRLLHYPLSKIRQPRVIAEIIGGIVLGPSILGRIPGFTDAIFPPASIPTLSLAAHLGLVLFLFLVGLEVDLRLLLANWRVALSVGAAGMILPFGLGCAIAYGLYHEFREDSGLVPISFGTYALFVGVATAITAFPVLCRILTELKLLQDHVGIVVLSAGVGNDVVGWILLALCVALVNAGSGITALYILLTSIAYVLFLVYAVRPALVWVLNRTGSIQNGPTQSIVALTVLLTLASAFFTGIIGIHPIFGAFLIGLICPHDGGFAIKLMEKIEDLVTVFFLPLYFALSGLSTNIGLLDSGITWAYVFGVIAVAFFGKVIGGTVAARLCKLVWRESFTVGALMSCKGLVELIVLNIGLEAKILSTRTFTIFVVMALVTTFATTPLTSALYPPWYRQKLAAWKRGEIDWDGTSLLPETHPSGGDAVSAEKYDAGDIRKLLVYLRLESLPGLFNFLSLLGGDRPIGGSRVHPSKVGAGPDGQAEESVSLLQKRPLQVHGLRMLELTERLSSVMKDTEIDDVSTKDPVVNSFCTFGQLNHLAVSGDVDIVPEGSYAEILAQSASQHASDMVFLPWSESGSLSETGSTTVEYSTQHRLENGPHSQFITSFLSRAPCHTAVFVNNGFGRPGRREGGGLHRTKSRLSLRSNHGNPPAPLTDRSHHIFFPFFGGVDDRTAMRFILRLARNVNVTATIVFVDVQQTSSSGEVEVVATDSEAPRKGDVQVSASASQETFFEQERGFFVSMKDSLPQELESRILFETVSTSQPLNDVIGRITSEVGQSLKSSGDLVVLGRSREGKVSFRTELHHVLATVGQTSHAGSDVGQSLGDVAQALMATEVKASLLVVEAKREDIAG
ncbi:MAG: hypothetical protein LQ348_003096 [Seirophora lacunosa]|nr:MAG: hypothetical protein LQ348_003096 [Seirophora lacunosa]